MSEGSDAEKPTAVAKALTLSAVGGLFAGLVACSSSGQTASDPDGESTATPTADVAEAKDCCKGKNECQGKGDCRVEGQQECKGLNECAKKGGCNLRCQE